MCCLCVCTYREGVNWASEGVSWPSPLLADAQAQLANVSVLNPEP